MDIISTVNEYNVISGKMKLLDTRKKELADTIKKHSQSEGVKDDKGSFYVNDNSDFLFGSVVKKTVKLNNEKAETFLKSKKLWKDVVVMTESIDENRLESLIAEDKITLQELEDMTDIKTSYSVLVKSKKEDVEDLPEIQVVNEKPKRAGRKSVFRKRG